MSLITFVTAFFNIYNYPIESEFIKNKFDKFKEIAITGIQICVYTEVEFINKFNELIIEYPNIKLMEPVNLKKTKISLICSKIDFTLPINRCEKMDNYDFMIFLNSKCELLENTVSINYWNSEYFAWIDFDISNIFYNLIESQEYLRFLSKLNLTSKFFTIGGWEKEKMALEKMVFDNIFWRFCGCFLLGDKMSIIEFTNLSNEYMEVYINMYKKLSWEINYWCWLETFVCWKPTWFHASFNESILKIPINIYCKKLNSIKTIHNYPNYNNFVPSSASHIFYRGNHILNTRYVNYLIEDHGGYCFLDPNKHIITKNVVSLLDNNFNPYSYNIMDDDSINLKQSENQFGSNYYIYGLEDIRLYEYNNKIKFIATNRNYAPANKNRIIIGDYNIESLTYDNCKLIESPNNYNYEKNWIPIISNNIENQYIQEDSSKKCEYFIYSWCPMEICKINMETNNLETIKKYYNTITAPNFNRVRGSTVFIDVDEYLLGVVHFSIDDSPRKYYHMLVSLNKETLCPLKYSEIFCFQHIGIEFCIGFWKQNNEYLFWVSKMDRNASFIKVNINEIPLCFHFSNNN
jgi:hypothetical protein